MMVMMINMFAAFFGAFATGINLCKALDGNSFSVVATPILAVLALTNACLAYWRYYKDRRDDLDDIW